MLLRSCVLTAPGSLALAQPPDSYGRLTLSTDGSATIMDIDVTVIDCVHVGAFLFHPAKPKCLIDSASISWSAGLQEVSRLTLMCDKNKVPAQGGSGAFLELEPWL